MVHEYCDGLGQASLQKFNVKLGRVAGALKQEEEESEGEESEDLPSMSLELKRNISAPPLQLVRNMSKNSEQKETTTEIMLTPAVEARMK